jgi:hypothetical protein
MREPPKPPRLPSPALTLDGYERQPQGHGLQSALARVERCACGGEIVATRMTDDDITDAVASHNRTRQHRAWSVWWHEQG